MTNYVYFHNVESLEQLKQQYRKLCFQFHPDVAGNESTSIMQKINAEYESIFAKVKNIFRNAKGETYHKDNPESSDEFKKIIESIIKMNMKNTTLEIIGVFLWLSGLETKIHKDTLKKIGFKWSANKSAWYYHNQTGYRKKSRKDLSMNDIRSMFNSTIVDYDSAEPASSHAAITPA